MVPVLRIPWSAFSAQSPSPLLPSLIFFLQDHPSGVLPLYGAWERSPAGVCRAWVAGDAKWGRGV